MLTSQPVVVVIVETFECDVGEFACASQRQCIDVRRRCDGVGDCDDSSDESNCCTHAH